MPTQWASDYFEFEDTQRKGEGAVGVRWMTGLQNINIYRNNFQSRCGKWYSREYDISLRDLITLRRHFSLHSCSSSMAIFFLFRSLFHIFYSRSHSLFLTHKFLYLFLSCIACIINITWFACIVCEHFVNFPLQIIASWK